MGGRKGLCAERGSEVQKRHGDSPGVEGLGRPGTRVGEGDRERKTGKRKQPGAKTETKLNSKSALVDKE